MLTGVALALPGGATAQPAGRDDDRDEAAQSAEEIDYYVAHGEWRGKAGGYALQGYGEVYVRHIAGSYSNVVGLPLAETRDAAQERGLSACLSGWSSEGSARPARALVEGGEIVEARILPRRHGPAGTSSPRGSIDAAGRNAVAAARTARNICCPTARRASTEGASARRSR